MVDLIDIRNELKLFVVIKKIFLKYIFRKTFGFKLYQSFKIWKP
jgi:hypothetical protein